MKIDNLKNPYDELTIDEYYLKRAVNASDDLYEENYWGKSVDPDGNVRFMADEWESKKEWASSELEFINDMPGGKVLDVGCGAGAILANIDSQWDRYGVEVSRLAAERAKVHGKIHVGDLESANFSSEMFDMVLLFHVIEHIDDPENLLSEIRRILTADGWLIIGTPDFDSGCARRFKNKYRMLHDKTHTSLFSNDSLQRLMLDYGYNVHHTEYEFFETKYFTEDNLLRLFDTKKVSPPFYGNIITKYCQKASREQYVDKIDYLKKKYQEIFQGNKDD